MRRLCVSALMLCLSAAASAAQDTPKWTIADERAPHTRGDARLVASDHARAGMAMFSQCMLERHRQSVEAAMDLPPGAQADATVAKLIDPDCLTGLRTMSAPAEVLRSGLFVARYRRDYADVVPKLPATTAGLSARLPVDGSRSRAVALRTIADCLWRADADDADDARSAILTVPGSREEAKAYDGLEEHLQGCSPTRPVRFSKAILGGLLAEVALLELATPA